MSDTSFSLYENFRVTIVDHFDNDTVYSRTYMEVEVTEDSRATAVKELVDMLQIDSHDLTITVRSM